MGRKQGNERTERCPILPGHFQPPVCLREKDWLGLGSESPPS